MSTLAPVRASSEAMAEAIVMLGPMTDTGDEISDIPDSSACQPLDILIVTARYVPEIGGTEMHTRELAERLSVAGHRVTVLTTDLHGKLPPVEVQSGITVRRVRAWPVRADYYFAPAMYRAITRGRWDIVHCQGYHTFVAPIAMLAARRAGIGYVVAFHSGGHSSRIRRSLRGLQGRALRPLLVRASWLIAGSVFEADHFREKLRLQPARLRIIPVLPSIPPVTAGADDGAVHLLSVGRLERYKGHHRLLEAMPSILARLPNARLRIVGEGPFEGQLREIVGRYGIGDYVEIGPIPADRRGEMAAALQRAAVVISLSDYESAGLAVREAYALGRPLLVTDASAFTDLAGESGVRVLTRSATAREIADAVVDRVLADDVAAAESSVDWDDCVVAYQAIYRTAIRGAMCAS